MANSSLLVSVDVVEDENTQTHALKIPQNSQYYKGNTMSKHNLIPLFYISNSCAPRLNPHGDEKR